MFKVFADLAVDPYQILMATVGTALQEIGYLIEVMSWILVWVNVVLELIGGVLKIVFETNNKMLSLVRYRKMMFTGLCCNPSC